MSDEERIARVARALCVADGHGPEVMIDVGDEVVDITSNAGRLASMQQDSSHLSACLPPDSSMLATR